VNLHLLQHLLDPANVLAALAWIAAAGMLIHGVCVCNHMSRKTALLYKAGMLVKTIAALAVVIGPWFAGFAPLIAYQAMVVGFALCRVFDQRDTLSRHRQPATINTREFTR
jgi:uncharacterized integral membrane protein